MAPFGLHTPLQSYVLKKTKKQLICFRAWIKLLLLYSRRTLMMYLNSSSGDFLLYSKRECGWPVRESESPRLVFRRAGEERPLYGGRAVTSLTLFRGRVFEKGVCVFLMGDHRPHTRQWALLRVQTHHSGLAPLLGGGGAVHKVWKQTQNVRGKPFFNADVGG